MLKYKFSDKLMFAFVMQDEALCKEFIERVFHGRKVEKLTFPNDIRAIPEKTIVTGLISKSVRLDVLFEGDDRYYDIEMQSVPEGFLPQRSRYYHASMDTHILKKGQPYSKLKECYVIFICLQDPFGARAPVQSFGMYDEKLGLHLGDGSYTIVLNIDCPKEKIPKELETFFAYVEKGEIATNDDFVQQIHQKVEEANRDAEVMEFMTLEEEMKVQEEFAFERGMEKGIEQGIEQGRTEGIAEGEKSGIERGAAQEKREIAKQMLKEGMTKELIAKLTGLTLREIQVL